MRASSEKAVILAAFDEDIVDAYQVSQSSGAATGSRSATDILFKNRPHCSINGMHPTEELITQAYYEIIEHRRGQVASVLSS